MGNPTRQTLSKLQSLFHAGWGTLFTDNNEFTYVGRLGYNESMLDLLRGTSPGENSQRLSTIINTSCKGQMNIGSIQDEHGMCAGYPEGSNTLPEASLTLLEEQP